MQSFSVFSSEFFVTQIYTDSGLVRSLKKNTQISQILLLEICVFFVPQISQIYTDSGLVRSLEKKHADFADDAVFLFGYLGDSPPVYGKNESV